MMEINDNIQLFKGDCLEIMKDIKDKSIDMIGYGKRIMLEIFN